MPGPVYRSLLKLTTKDGAPFNVVQEDLRDEILLVAIESTGVRKRFTSALSHIDALEMAQFVLTKKGKLVLKTREGAPFYVIVEGDDEVMLTTIEQGSGVRKRFTCVLHRHDALHMAKFILGIRDAGICVERVLRESTSPLGSPAVDEEPDQEEEDTDPGTDPAA